MKTTPQKDVKKFKYDITLIALLLILATISVVSIYLADPIMASYLRGTGIWQKQLFWYLLSFVMCLGLIKLGVDRLFTGVTVFYWILMALLIILLVDKYLINLPDSLIRPINGTTAWIIIPKIGNIQPSEFMKIVLILECANVIHKHNQTKTEMSFESDLMLFLKIIKVALPPLFLIFLQPDTGIPIVIVCSIVVMLMVGGIRKEWVLIGVVFIIVIVASFLYLFYFQPNILTKVFGNSYKLARFYGWLQTDKYYLTYGNQLYTALLTIGSSGLTGHELNQAIISFAEPQTDFIFAVIGQNFGFLGTSFVVFIITIFDIKIINIALEFKGERERIMTAGLLGMLIFQQIQNMGMIIGLLPITGITLPLISYGGSSMLSYFIPFAVLFYMSSENKSALDH